MVTPRLTAEVLKDVSAVLGSSMAVWRVGANFSTILDTVVPANSSIVSVVHDIDMDHVDVPLSCTEGREPVPLPRDYQRPSPLLLPPPPQRRCCCPRLRW